MVFSIPTEDTIKAHSVAEDAKFLEPVRAGEEPAEQYPDRGVKYSGYAKKELGSGSYTRIRQQTKFYSLLLQGVGAGSHTYTRDNSTKTTFYCTKIVITHYGVSIFPMETRISDVLSGNAAIKFQYYPIKGEDKLFVDLSDCPREFSGDSFDFYTQSSIGAADYMHFQLFGWIEDK